MTSNGDADRTEAQRGSAPALPAQGAADGTSHGQCPMADRPAPSAGAGPEWLDFFV